ncbi:hypothetical protein HPP92_001991 [Vanilla planifolia]|uniref:K+ potassium transporter integral membrane domain-containing protein n=1 Tax=Vanilla planifolia TaxID=51239 RepID=A0A835RRP8_VANPL|nr:hypothetical protein HPP92_001991 [Vanilla planifolia]
MSNADTIPLHPSSQSNINEIENLMFDSVLSVPVTVVPEIPPSPPRASITGFLLHLHQFATSTTFLSQGSFGQVDQATGACSIASLVRRSSFLIPPRWATTGDCCCCIWRAGEHAHRTSLGHGKKGSGTDCENLKLVVFPNPYREDPGKALRDWDHWEPFFFIVFLELTLSWLTAKASFWERTMDSVEDGHGNHVEETPDEVITIPNLSSNAFSFVESYEVPRRKTTDYTLLQTLLLGYQSLGVVYGDIGTSPLYVFSSITLSQPEEKDILGILSLIFWTLTTMGLIKYVFIVLRADDHGEGGTFALYSLLRQHVNFKGKMVATTTRLASDVNLLYHSKGCPLQNRTKKFLEESSKAQAVITFIVLLGTCMVIGDGALTPAISGNVVLLSVAILVILFLFQRFGTSKVSFSFSPIMVLWFSFTAGIGLYNVVKFYPWIMKALSPNYIVCFFQRNHRKGWELLGAVALCITGAEAMFADLGHFNKRGIQLSYSFVVYPALILAYSGEAAYLIKNPDKISTAFYSSVPEPIFWPMFVVATLAAVVASQALISASFSIIRQSVALGCFPRVTMVHTSAKHEGQVYSPEVNYFLMLVCILITVGFNGGAEIGNAFGKQN